MRIALVYHVDGPRRRIRRAAALARVLTARGHSLTEHDSETFRLSQDAPDAELLCICGGDGTARLVLDRQEELSTLPPVAIYPAGTINLLARELGYPRSPEDFARHIEQDTQRRRYPLARIGGSLFLACASIGADALAVAAVSLSLKSRIGRLAYLVGAAPMLWRWPRHALHVLADGEAFEAEAVFVLRGIHYAGPWTLDRAANLGRDRLHVLALPRARRRDALRLAIYMLTGARHPHKEWRLLQLSEMRIGAEQVLPVQADGDIIAATPVDIRMTNQSVSWL